MVLFSTQVVSNFLLPRSLINYSWMMLWIIFHTQNGNCKQCVTKSINMNVSPFMLAMTVSQPGNISKSLHGNSQDSTQLRNTVCILGEGDTLGFKSWTWHLGKFPSVSFFENAFKKISFLETLIFHTGYSKFSITRWWKIIKSKIARLCQNRAIG